VRFLNRQRGAAGAHLWAGYKSLGSNSYIQNKEIVENNSQRFLITKTQGKHWLCFEFKETRLSLILPHFQNLAWQVILLWMWAQQLCTHTAFWPLSCRSGDTHGQESPTANQLVFLYVLAFGNAFCPDSENHSLLWMPLLLFFPFLKRLACFIRLVFGLFLVTNRGRKFLFTFWALVQS
jgi:hypothetical protein